MPTGQEQHLAAIRAALTADEAAWFDAAVAKLTPECLARIARMPVDLAVQQLRWERGVSTVGLTTRAPGFRCDDPDSLTDTPGHELEE